jgi:hypothetical protein
MARGWSNRGVGWDTHIPAIRALLFAARRRRHERHLRRRHIVQIALAGLALGLIARLLLMP